MLISIVGQGTLAAATAECCDKPGRHSISNSARDISIMWVAYDTPLDAERRPDSEWVMRRIREDIFVLDQAQAKPLILVSSQMPVGTIARLEREFQSHTFAYQPENIRVKTAVQDFENQARVVIGRRDSKHDQLLADLFAPFTKRMIFTDPETAEMTKHVLNTYLGMSIAYSNEMAKICKTVGADPLAITEALRSDVRVSPKAPLLPGGPFNSGHLERDIFVMNELAKKHKLSVPIIENIMASNCSK